MDGLGHPCGSRAQNAHQRRSGVDFGDILHFGTWGARLTPHLYIRYRANELNRAHRRYTHSLLPREPVCASDDHDRSSLSRRHPFSVVSILPPRCRRLEPANQNRRRKANFGIRDHDTESVVCTFPIVMPHVARLQSLCC